MDPSWDIEKKTHATFSFLSFPGEKNQTHGIKKRCWIFVAIIFFPDKSCGSFREKKTPGSRVLNLAIIFFPIPLMDLIAIGCRGNLEGPHPCRESSWHVHHLGHSDSHGHHLSPVNSTNPIGIHGIYGIFTYIIHHKKLPFMFGKYIIDGMGTFHMLSNNPGCKWV